MSYVRPLVLYSFRLINSDTGQWMRRHSKIHLLKHSVFIMPLAGCDQCSFDVHHINDSVRLHQFSGAAINILSFFSGPIFPIPSNEFFKTPWNPNLRIGTTVRTMDTRYLINVRRRLCRSDRVSERLKMSNPSSGPLFFRIPYTVYMNFGLFLHKLCIFLALYINFCHFLPPNL